MVIYQHPKKIFVEHVRADRIDGLVASFLLSATGHSVSDSERESWRKSMRYMRDVLRDPAIPDDAGVSIEYHIPQTSKRIDFILTGQDGEGVDHALLIELKQWSKAELTGKDGVVKTAFFGEVSHPSYQAWSYAALLQGFNETVYTENIQLNPCAYLHNYIEDDVIKNDFYDPYLQKAPVFLEGDAEKEKLQAFIKRFVKVGDKTGLMYRIDRGRIRPSKKMSESLNGLLKGRQEFVLIDGQKVVFENILAAARGSSGSTKRVLIVQGGPGTGKTVVAINALAKLSRLGLLAQYVSKNAAVRQVFESLLTGSFRRTEIGNFFSGSGAYVSVERNIFDVLLVDEAHRLNEKSGMFRNKGENQIKEIMEAARCSVFFLDEDQRVTWLDIGERGEIERWAKHFGAEVQYFDLPSQFRCSGSDGYVAWLDDILQIRETANGELERDRYDFRVFDSPTALRDAIFEKNVPSNSARLVAGYCWEWRSRKNPNASDIEFPEFGFGMKWNLASEGGLWILSPTSVNEVGCIHTCQGLDLEYVGVIVGPDLVARDGRIVTDPTRRAKTDSSIKGFKVAFKKDPEAATKKADAIIKRTYRALMTRGMKGCYIFSPDPETREYFRSRIAASVPPSLENPFLPERSTS